MSSVLYWFRNDLRLADNPCFTEACAAADRLLPLYIHDIKSEQNTAGGFARMGAHRHAVLATALAGLDQSLRARGSRLYYRRGQPVAIMTALAQCGAVDAVWVEDIAAPEERAEVDALRQALEPMRIAVRTRWQSSLIAPAALPFAVANLPDVFTRFRTQVEKATTPIDKPCPAPESLPVWPERAATSDQDQDGVCLSPEPLPIASVKSPDPRSAFPYFDITCRVDEAHGEAHLAQYLARGLPHTYKATRNQLIGLDYSSKWSPYLALGVLSARQIYAALQQFEHEQGANEGSYWLWFELLWRDYFRFLHLKYGQRLYRACGLAPHRRAAQHDSAQFRRWMNAQTGHAFVDAAMTELTQTGYLSNRMRQVAASYLIHDLGCDWRAGAAWFESQLVDYDVYSNQGNWLYLAGYGTDPRGGRRFNPDKQASDYDPQGQYRALWL